MRIAVVKETFPGEQRVALVPVSVPLLTKAGLEVVATTYVGEDLGNYGQSDLTPEAVFDLGLRADHLQAEGLVLSCTDMRSVEVIEALEAALGKPVVTSNQALMYCAIKGLGLGSAGLPGRLFSRLSRAA